MSIMCKSIKHNYMILKYQTVVETIFMEYNAKHLSYKKCFFIIVIT